MKGTAICDGRGNAGTGARAAVLCIGDGPQRQRHVRAETIAPTTNIVAEHRAIQLAMELAKEHGVTDLVIYNDSQTPVNHVNGTYKVMQEHLIPIVAETWEMRSAFASVEVCWKPREHTSSAVLHGCCQRTAGQDGRRVAAGTPSPGRAAELERVRLADEIDAEAVVRLFGDQAEPALEIDAPRGGERVVRPQHHALVARGAREVQACVDESATEVMAARQRVDQEQAQARGRRVVGHAEHAAGATAVDLGDPGRLAIGLRRRGVVGDDARDERLHRRVPPELARVDLAVCHDDPAEVARLAEGADRGLRDGH